MLLPTLTQVDSSAKFKVGQRYQDDRGRVFIYLQGIASVAAGDWVRFTLTALTGSTTVLAAAGHKGPLAVAQSAVVASTFGWFQIYGLCLIAQAISEGDAAVSAPVYLTSTAGSVDDVVVTGDRVEGAFFTVQEGEVALGNGYAGVYLTHPFAGDEGEFAANPDLTSVDAAAAYSLGKIYRDAAGSEYIYLQGLALTITGDWVTYRITSEAAAVTTRAIAGSQGSIAIAMAAIVAGKFGWYQITGLNLGAGAISGGNAAAAAAVYLTSTAGLMDDVEVSDDRVSGAVFSVQEGELSGNPVALAGVTIFRPFCGMGWPVRPTLAQVDSSALYNVGRRFTDEVTGNVYIYLKGIGSVVTGDLVTYRITSTTVAVTKRAVHGDVGPCAVAMAAIINTKFGWFQIAGNNLTVRAINGGSAAAGTPVYLTATAGEVDDVEVEGDRLQGAYFSVTESSNVAGVTLAYPHLGANWPVVPLLTQIDNSALYDVGRRYCDLVSGNVWVYLSGITSCIEGSWLTYYITSNAASVTALLAANAVGLVAIAVGALENTKYGWAQIAGNNLRARAATGGDAAAGAIVYRQADGICDDQVAAGDMVYGAIWSIQEGELAGNPAALAGVTIAYPFVTDEST